MALMLDNNVWARLLQTNVITGLILLVLGIILALLAGKITKIFRKQDEIASNDRVFLTIKAFALVIILASLIVMIIE